jgi:hypothetical protein
MTFRNLFLAFSVLATTGGIAACVDDNSSTVVVHDGDASVFGDASTSNDAGSVSDTSTTVDANSRGDGGASCGDVPGNLVSNGSFQLGAAGWTPTGTSTVGAGDAGGQDCLGSYGIVTTTDTFSGVDAFATVPAAADAGADAGPVTVDFGVWLRPLDGQTDALAVKLANFNVQPIQELDVNSPVVLPPGSWTQVTGTMLVTPGTLNLRIVADKQRTFGVDHAWVKLH